MNRIFYNITDGEALGDLMKDCPDVNTGIQDNDIVANDAFFHSFALECLRRDLSCEQIDFRTIDDYLQTAISNYLNNAPFSQICQRRANWLQHTEQLFADCQGVIRRCNIIISGCNWIGRYQARVFRTESITKDCERDIVGVLNAAMKQIVDDVERGTEIPYHNNDAKRLVGILGWCDDEQNNLTFVQQLTTYPLNDDIRNLAYLATKIINNADNVYFSYFDKSLRFFGMWAIIEQLCRITERITSVMKQRGIEPTADHVAPSTMNNQNREQSPDFNSLYSYTPIRPFNMTALYEFLVKRGVIKNCDVQRFADCVTHAHFEPLWRDGVQYKLKCVIRHLKEHFDRDWELALRESIGQSKKNLSKFNRKDMGDFETKLTDII